MKLTRAKNTADVMRWIVSNPHYEGWWSGPQSNPYALHLRGKGVELVIPASIHTPGMMEPDDFETTGRMFRPSEFGRRSLEDGGTK